MRQTLLLWVAVALLAPISGTARAQDITAFDRDRGLLMLRAVRRDLEQYYYDSTYHGLDLAARFDSATARVRAAQSNGEILGIIALLLLELNDSHTWFLAPQRVNEIDHGWDLQMFGDSCYVVDVDPKSDAAAQGITVGDQVLAVNRFAPSRQDLWKVLYWIHNVDPQPVVELIVRSRTGAVRRLVVRAKVTPGQRIIDLTGSDGGSDIGRLIRKQEDAERRRHDVFVRFDTTALIWRMNWFRGEEAMDDGMDRAAKSAALILDLRRNPGGLEAALLRLLGRLLPARDTIGFIQRRRERRPLVVKPVGRRPYAGKVVVLLDSRSASAAELLGRTLQLRGRAVVVGDRSTGAVQRSIGHHHQVGTQTAVLYAASITDADIVMSDGARLEHAGVVPDETLLPTAEDLAAGRDPVLARALELVGVPIHADSAGKLLPPRRNPR
jgi:C-terminal processing protease CtpA/Prc